MNIILFITGTDTGVGKTQVTAGIAASVIQSQSAAQQSLVTLWKPVQTGTSIGSTEADSFRLRWGSGTAQSEEDIVSVTLPDPLAPWMASELAGRPIDYESLLAEGRRRKKESDVLLAEGAGGLAVPMTADKLTADLAADLELRVLIVARPALGTINHTLLTIAFARQKGLDIAGVILNGCRPDSDPPLNNTVNALERFGGVSVIGRLPWVPCNPKTDAEWRLWRDRWARIVAEKIDVPALLYGNRQPNKFT